MDSGGHMFSRKQRGGTNRWIRRRSIPVRHLLLQAMVLSLIVCRDDYGTYWQIACTQDWTGRFAYEQGGTPAGYVSLRNDWFWALSDLASM